MSLDFGDMGKLKSILFQLERTPPTRAQPGYSIFDSALYKGLNVEWLFSQEKATLHDLSMATCESKML
jgi:hypothetical protein